MMRSFVAAFLVVGFFAGCAGPGADDAAPLATAREAIAVADRAARAWNAGASLFGASAFELDESSRTEFEADLKEERDDLEAAYERKDISKDDYDNISALLGIYQRIVDTPDKAPGDGRAPVWVFTYLDGEATMSFTVAVARGEAFYRSSDEEVLAEFNLDSGVMPVGDWAIDSDDAAEAGKLANPDYAVLCAAKDILAFSTLVHGEDGPVWLIGAERQVPGESPSEAYLAVDAATGSLVQDEVVAVEEALYQEAGRSGDNTFGAPATADVEFEIEDERHLQMAVLLAVSPAPVQEVRVTVMDPLGAATSFSVVAGEAPFFAENAVLLAGTAGLYRVHVETAAAVRLDYEVSWCTDGIPTSQGDFVPRACGALPESQTPPGGETLSRLASSVRAW